MANLAPRTRLVGTSGAGCGRPEGRRSSGADGNPRKKNLQNVVANSWGFSSGHPKGVDSVYPKGYTLSVEIRPRRIEEYLVPSGKSPFGAWLEGLKDRQARAAIRKRLNRIRLGNLGDSKPLGDGVHELRIDFGPGYRVYYGIDGDTVVVLLCGGDKSSQTRDIAKAKQYWTDYWS